MKYLRQLGILLGIGLGAELISQAIGLPIPGNVLGMMMLLAFLSIRLIKIEMIEDISHFLLNHLAFFFIPAGVGLIANLDLLKEYWWPLIVICLASTVMVMVVTGLTVQFIKRRLKS